MKIYGFRRVACVFVPRMHVESHVCIRATDTDFSDHLAARNDFFVGRLSLLLARVRRKVKVLFLSP